MVMFTRKVHRKLGGNFTFLVLTDRDDLDTQIYKTFAGCGVVSEQEPCRAASGHHLNELLTQHKAYVFSLIQNVSAGQCGSTALRYRTRSCCMISRDSSNSPRSSAR